MDKSGPKPPPPPNQTRIPVSTRQEQKFDQHASSQPPTEPSSAPAESQSGAAWPERTNTSPNTTAATATTAAEEDLKEQRTPGRRTVSPPPPEVHKQKRFSCFLSHYKREAGTEARLVKQILAPHIKKDLFLDSGMNMIANSRENPFLNQNPNPTQLPTLNLSPDSSPKP